MAKGGTRAEPREKRAPSGGISEVDAMIRASDDWRGPTLSHLRAVILATDPRIIEEVKWKKPSRPEGVPVWSWEGMLCVADTLRAAVRVTFPRGAQIPDPRDVFNTRLDSRSVRAVDVHEADRVDEAALRAVVRAAIRINEERAAATRRAR